jgi:hypothetical protein
MWFQPSGAMCPSSASLMAPRSRRAFTARSRYTEVDRLLGEIFKNNRAVTGIKFLGLENPHTATPDEPYWSASGKAYAGISQAAARGDMKPEEAIAAYRAAANPEATSG